MWSYTFSLSKQKNILYAVQNLCMYMNIVRPQQSNLKKSLYLKFCFDCIICDPYLVAVAYTEGVSIEGSVVFHPFSTQLFSLFTVKSIKCCLCRWLWS